MQTPTLPSTAEGNREKIEEIKIPCPVSDGHPYLPDTQCTACKGEGTADCYLCKGTGLIMIDCGECGGLVRYPILNITPLFVLPVTGMHWLIALLATVLASHFVIPVMTMV